MRVFSVVLPVLFLFGCTQDTSGAPADVPKVAAEAPSTDKPSAFLDAVEENEPQPSIADQADEAERRREGRIPRNNRGQPARTRRDHAEDASRAP